MDSLALISSLTLAARKLIAILLSETLCLLLFPLSHTHLLEHTVTRKHDPNKDMPKETL